jgi:hypothetical protein
LLRGQSEIHDLTPLLLLGFARIDSLQTASDLAAESPEQIHIIAQIDFMLNASFVDQLIAKIPMPKTSIIII